MSSIGGMFYPGFWAGISLTHIDSTSTSLHLHYFPPSLFVLFSLLLLLLISIVLSPPTPLGQKGQTRAEIAKIRPKAKAFCEKKNKEEGIK